MYFVLTAVAAVLAISTAGPTTSSPQVCPKPPSVNNATLADLTGSLQYLKYVKSVKFDRDIDGLAYRFDRQGDSNSYTVTITVVYYGGTKKEETMIWMDHPTENKLEYIKNSGDLTYYSIPYLDKNKSAVMFTCYEANNTVRQFIQVLTSNLDNDLTKAVEEARKIAGSDLKELPYEFKNAFLA